MSKIDSIIIESHKGLNMLRDYAVFKNNTADANKYYQECIDQVKVHIVIAKYVWSEK